MISLEAHAVRGQYPFGYPLEVQMVDFDPKRENPLPYARVLWNEGGVQATMYERDGTVVIDVEAVESEMSTLVVTLNDGDLHRGGDA